jgi:hypothetical protein
MYDITAGTIVFELTVSPAIYDDDSASVSVTDVFRVTGLPSGGPLTFQARLDVSGEGYGVYVGQHNYASAQTEIGLREGASNGSSRVYTTSGQGPSTQAVNITASPEEPFTLTLFAKGRALGYHHYSATTARGRLVFGNLPQGASVVSCGGYFNDQPVATRKSTWGRLKQIYR